MAVTQGHGNPDWTRDEVMLALDLYLSCSGVVPSGKDPRVIALSETLRGLSIHPADKRVGTFRNPDGISFKLQNIRQVALGKGLGNVSRIDREVWAAYGAKPSDVRAIASQILALAGAQAPLIRDESDGEVEFAEGRVLTALHFRRERKPQLRKALLARRAKLGRLSCDGCGWHSGAIEELIAHAAFEAHHLQPLSSVGPSNTKLTDVALLCATCHRLVHRWIAVNGEWLSKDRIAAVVAPRSNSR